MERTSSHRLERLLARLRDLVKELFGEVPLNGRLSSLRVTKIDFDRRQLANVERQMIAVKQTY